jgi:hypothetical protein
MGTTVHMILQGKGGVGKSFIAAAIAQYKMKGGAHPVCIDTDPVNSTFAGYKSIGAKRLQILDGDEINTRNFDALVEQVAHSKDDVIIDNGATSFVPLSHYLISNKVPALLKDMAHPLVIHTVVTGGQALLDTTSGFSHAVSQFSDDVAFVIWLNPYWGPVELEGKSFEQMKVYINHRARVSGIVRIPSLKAETYGRDLSDMLQSRLTFDEALAMESLTIMTRQRLKIIQTLLYEQMAAVPAI